MRSLHTGRHTNAYRIYCDARTPRDAHRICADSHPTFWPRVICSGPARKRTSAFRYPAAWIVDRAGSKPRGSGWPQRSCAVDRGWSDPYWLLESLRRALLARRVMNDMLRQHGRGPQRRRTWWLRPLLFPFPWRPRSVMRTGPIFYGTDSRQRLDVYRPRNARVPGPVLVYFHGGGYSSGGNRREARTLLYHLAAQGWTCISAAYRLRPRFGFEEHLADARAALTWAHDHADVHGGNTDTVVMAGSSAGGHLTALCALTQHEPMRRSPSTPITVDTTEETNTNPRFLPPWPWTLRKHHRFLSRMAPTTRTFQSKTPGPCVITWDKARITRSGTRNCPAVSTGLMPMLPGDSAP